MKVFVAEQQQTKLVANSTPGGGFRRGIAGTKSHSSKKRHRIKTAASENQKNKIKNKKSAIANRFVNSAACR